MALFVLAVSRDGLTAPADYFARSNRRCVMVVESNTFLQNRGDDTVAAVAEGTQGVIHYRRLGVVLAVPFHLAAERDGLAGTEHRQNCQNQFIDAVLVPCCTKVVEIMPRFAYTGAVQTRTAAPTEVLVRADGLLLDEMVTRLVLRQYQPPDIIAPGL